MAIAKTASRNVAFKVAKMRDSIMEDQDDLIVRKPECDEVGSELNAKAAVEDVGHNNAPQTCILPYKRTTCKIRSLLSGEVCATFM